MGSFRAFRFGDGGLFSKRSDGRGKSDDFGGALKAWGTVTEYKAGDLGRKAVLTVNVGKDGEMTFQVPKNALINGEISEGSMVGVTYKVVGDKNDHIFVATIIDGPRNLRTSGNTMPYTMPMVSSETVIPSQCSVC